MSRVMKLFFIYLFSLLFVTSSFPLNNREGGEIKRLSRQDFLESMKNQTLDEKPWFDLSSRTTKAILLSAIIPGAGQTYLGSDLKGIGFTLAFFGTGLAALSNHSNFIGREERLKVLVENYQRAGDFTTANRAWNDIVFEKANRENDYERRNLFAYLTIGVWVLNMVDVILFSDDKGEDEFTSLQPKTFEIGLSSYSQFNGIAIKFNLP